ncbi:MAG: hypothetical protein N3D14_05205 [Aquificaceae bacterium]|nr:hypothetical protein [Aquificaceae bacterium]MCX8164775.1 hypothetical protein [Aquificaceae bacterium]
MVKWISGIIVAFLLIDHFWVHFGGPMAERLRGGYREELKKGFLQKEEVPLQQSYRKSILDELWEKGKGLLKGNESRQEQ